MPWVLALFNQAGGVGKTTLAQNLAHAIARQGKRVLAVDLDPQASLTAFCGQEESPALAQALLDTNAPPPPTLACQGFDLWPGDEALVRVDMDPPKLTALRKRLQGVEADVVLIDCPPSLGRLSLLALLAADAVLVPVETQFKAWMGTGRLLRTLAQMRESHPTLRIAGFVPMQYDHRTRADREALAAMRNELEALAPVFAPIPRATAWVEASAARLPLALYRPEHPGLEALDELAARLTLALPQPAAATSASSPPLLRAAPDPKPAPAPRRSPKARR